jgi:dienelactone hydrolase
MAQDGHAGQSGDPRKGHFASGRPVDSYGALHYLASLPFVDRHRAAVIGFSQGGSGALSAATARRFDLIATSTDLAFRVAVAFYPWCGVAGDMAVPTLIMIGALDDWTPARDCERMMATRTGDGAPVELVVYPGAHHSFDNPALGAGQRLFGHWLQYDAAAAEDARARTRAFLARHLDEIR